jgi:hypothetical protein
MKDPLVRAQHYRDQAAKLRAMAEAEDSPISRKSLLTLADQYDRLCNEMLVRATGEPSSPV